MFCGRVFKEDYKNPTKPPAAFSWNVVRLDVSGSDLVDVMFIDLPGVISNVKPSFDMENEPGFAL